MTSPLFKSAWQALSNASKQEATVRQLGKSLSSLRSNSTNIMREARRLMSDTSSLGERERYGRVADFVRQHIMREVIRQLGPMGELVDVLLRPQGRSLTDRVADEMRAALQLLDQLQRVEPPSRPGWFGRPQTQPNGPGGGNRPPVSTAPISPQPERSGVPEGQVEMRALGRRYQFNRNDPILTGEMIPVISSNVHSIGYEWHAENPTKGVLKVRYLESKGKKSRTRVPGPMYDYFGVHPEVFMAFQLAASKGRFVWDRLRVRGTVTGHRFQYELDDLGDTMQNGQLRPSEYVPRKATRLGPNEHFLKRQFTDRRTGMTHTSQLEDEFHQRIGQNRNGPQGFVPNRGTPNRGTPNRGR